MVKSENREAVTDIKIIISKWRRARAASQPVCQSIEELIKKKDRTPFCFLSVYDDDDDEGAAKEGRCVYIRIHILVEKPDPIEWVPGVHWIDVSVRFFFHEIGICILSYLIRSYHQQSNLCIYASIRLLLKTPRYASTRARYACSNHPAIYPFMTSPCTIASPGCFASTVSTFELATSSRSSSGIAIHPLTDPSVASILWS